MLAGDAFTNEGVAADRRAAAIVEAYLLRSTSYGVARCVPTDFNCRSRSPLMTFAMQRGITARRYAMPAAMSGIHWYPRLYALHVSEVGLHNCTQL